MKPAQRFLLDKGLSDRIISNPCIQDASKWVYTSDAMEMYIQDHIDTIETLKESILTILDGNDINDLTGFTGLLSAPECRHIFDVRNDITAERERRGEVE